MAKHVLQKRIVNVILPTLMLISFVQTIHAHSSDRHHEHKGTPKPKVTKLLNSELSNLPGLEVKISEVTIPPNTELPKHWHPGDEFGYVIKGSVIHWQKDGQPRLVKAGDAVKIPVGQIHTAITRQEGATVLIFRIHPKGQAERIMVEK